MTKPLRLLILEDNPSDAELARHELRRAGYDPIGDRVATEEEYRHHLHPTLDVILADFTMPGLDALRALEIVQEKRLDIPFIIVSGTIGEERAVQVMQHGAADYIIKDRLTRLGQAVANALEKRAMRSDKLLAERRLSAQHATTKVLADSPSQDAAFPQIIEAVCRSMGWVWAAVWMVDAHGEKLQLAHSWHSSSAKLDDFLEVCREKTFVLGEGLPGRVWAAGEPVWAPDLMHDDNFFGKHAAVEAGLHGAFVCPIMLGRQAVGVIEFFSQCIEQRNEKILEMMGAIGSQIGQFIDRKRVEEGLRLFRALIDQTTDLIEVIDPESGRFLDVNEKACVVHGYTREEYLTLKVSDLDPLGATTSWGDVISDLRRIGSHILQSQHRRKDGSTFPVEVNMNFIRLDRDYLVAVVRDISERRHLEDQIRQAQKMEAIGLLAGGIAHDFNNLLCIINGYSDLVLEGLPPEDLSFGFLTEIRAAGERSVALTRQLLAFSRKEVVAPRALDLNAVVTDAEKMLRRIIGEDVQLDTCLGGCLGNVWADEGQLQQVLMNLAVNARDAMPQGGPLTIVTRNVVLGEEYAKSHAAVRPGPYVLLSVSDGGCGMTAQVRARIFEPFFTTKAPGRGTGMGLAVIYGVVAEAGGHIDVHTEPGAGTTFNVYLPRIDQPAHSGESQSQPKLPPRGTETALLVEDDDGVRLLSRHLLEGLGYAVLEASGGADALGIAAKHVGPVHLLITDVVMPGMSGQQVASSLARLHKETKVLFMSGYTDDAVFRHGILQDRVHFLHKPFSPTALACKVREVLDSPRADPA